MGAFGPPPNRTCESYLLFPNEVSVGRGIRISVYFFGLAYCFVGLSVVTTRLFDSMERIVKQTREVESVDPATGDRVVRAEKVWNYAIADITLLAFGTSFPQISLATVEAVRNLGNVSYGGLGPGTLIGSAAFDLFPIHAVCVLVPKGGSVRKISDLGVWMVELFWSFWAYFWLYIILQVWTPGIVSLLEALLTVLQFGLLVLHVYAQDRCWPYLSIPLEKGERPEDWVPEDSVPSKQMDVSDECFQMLELNTSQGRGSVNVFSIHPGNVSVDGTYQPVPKDDLEDLTNQNCEMKVSSEDSHVFSDWVAPSMDLLKLGTTEPQNLGGGYVQLAKSLWELVLLPWRAIIAVLPSVDLAHGWITFLCTLTFICGISFMVTRLTDVISCVAGINPYVLAITVLASGTSWPDLVASKLAAERQTTADSAIANITCSNAVNIYIGIGIPWIISTSYNFFAHKQSLQIRNSEGLTFSILVFFATSAGCVSILVLRRLLLGGELGGPKLWAWLTCAYLLLLWLIFVLLSSLKISAII